jgi:predicted transcriptional regulator YheO
MPGLQVYATTTSTPVTFYVSPDAQTTEYNPFVLNYNSDDGSLDIDDTIASNVADLIDILVDKSIALIGKAPADMNKEEKKTAIGFLNDQGAFLITGAGDKISEFFGISKFTLYTYLNDKKIKK